MRAIRAPFLVVMTVCGLVPALAQASPVSILATQSNAPGFESVFTLDFGGGFTENSQISNTTFELQVDADPSPTGAAQFLSYNQDVASLNLPDPMGGTTPIPTGDINVSILPGTSGLSSYNPATGEFTTTETYRIFYAGDLSAYGLTDGFVDFESTSTGVITYLTANSGTIAQTWSGTYAFPGSPVSINYICSVNTEFVPEPATLALLGLGGLFLRRRR